MKLGRQLFHRLLDDDDAGCELIKKYMVYFMALMCAFGAFVAIMMMIGTGV